MHFAKFSVEFSHRSAARRSWPVARSGQIAAAALLAGLASLPASAEALEEEIIVQAHPLSAEGLASPYDVLQGAELERKRGPTLGETLAAQPGIHNSSFGAASGRPVIHGLDGPRVRVMEDRIDAMDVSVTSADHATTIDPFVAERVEVLKGPATLLYGSGAVGGAVDVHTGRIPHEPAEQPISGRAELRTADNGDRRSGAFRLEGGKGNIAWHADGFTRDADEYEVGGAIESARLRREEAAEEGGEVEPPEGGDLEGSDFETIGGAFGLSWVGDRGFAGVAISRLESDYGLPGGHEHAHEEGEEESEEEEEEGVPLLTLEQTRIDIEAGLTDPFAGFSALNVRLGHNDYEHMEIEPDGEVATTFENDATELRIELVHEPWGGFDGAIGLQLQDREFSAVGEEAFIAPVDSLNMGVFWVGQRDLGIGSLELGARIEEVSYEPSASEDTDFTAGALSAGLVLPLSDRLTGTLILDWASRAPVGEELYSDGPHLATQSFEIGDPDLDNEQVTRLSSTLRYRGDRLRLEATAYIAEFGDFIVAQQTGEEEDELPVFVYGQQDASFVGLDLAADWTAMSWQGGSLNVRGMADWVSAELDVSGNDNVPRLAPMRIGAGVDVRHGALQLGLDWLRVSAADDPAFGELATGGFDDLSLYAGWSFGPGVGGDGMAVEVFLQGDNLTDDEQRHHTSFIKDTAPLPGRTVTAGIRVGF